MFTLQSNSVMHRKKKKRRSFKNERLKEHLRDLGADSWGCCVVSVCVLVSRWGNRNVIWMLWCLFWSSLFTISHTHSVMHRKKRKRLWKRKVGKERKSWKRGLSLSAAGLMFFWKNEPCAFKGTVLLLRNAISYKRRTHTHTHTHPHCTHSLRAPCSHQ